jgi:hypothetical protein
MVCAVAMCSWLSDGVYYGHLILHIWHSALCYGQCGLTYFLVCNLWKFVRVLLYGCLYETIRLFFYLNWNLEPYPKCLHLRGSELCYE